MANELETTQKQIRDSLAVSIDNATAIITKNYLDRLETYDLICPSEEDIDIDVSSCGAFFKLQKLVLNKEENFLNKLTTIVNVASSIECSLATVIRSNGDSIEYYVGIISKHYREDKSSSRNRRKADVAAFRGALTGNLMGSEMEEVAREEVWKFCEETFQTPEQCFSAVSGIVALRDDEDKSMEGYVQGIENLVDSLRGQTYTIVMFADPVTTSEIQVMKQGYELLYTQLSSFLKTSVTFNESDSVSLSKAHTDGVTEGISKGISMTQSKTLSKGRYMGVSASISGSLKPLGVGVEASVGVSGGTNRGTSHTTGQTTNKTETTQRTRQESSTVQSGTTTGKSLQLAYENRSVKSLLDRIDRYLERLDQCESFGAFDCAAYVIADTRETALAVASNYNALMRGKNSSVQASHINTWHKPEDTKILGQYLRAFVHPRFRADKESKVIVTPASVVSGNEMAIQIGLPKKSVAGVTVVPMAPFGRNVLPGKSHSLVLGNLYHMGYDEGGVRPRKVEIDIESLTMHTFITGSTGAGKSTAIYSILDKLMDTPVLNRRQETIKFLVIEPAKGEYKNRFGYYENVKVYGTNEKKTPLLRINPFSFPKDVHVLEHIERLIEIFNVCWPMYAAMPAVLKDAIERAYMVSGWNLDASECSYTDLQGTPLYPDFTDVLNQIHLVINESQYSSDSKGDYKGALCTRLKSLTNGLYGKIFTSSEIPARELFDENVIVDLSRTGSGETKALLMGLLVMKLQEYRMAASSENQPLQHVTVLEEAHHLLKRTQTQQSGESANVLGKSVEMLANSIAEMRTYGEGFIIADQAPGLLDMSVIRNTNTKIILRLPDLSDRDLAGRAAGLNEEQIVELARLKTFVAAVYQNDWMEPVLCNLDTNFKESRPFTAPFGNREKEAEKKRELIRFLLAPVGKRKVLDRTCLDNLTQVCLNLSVSSEAKAAFLKYLQATDKKELQHLRGTVLYAVCNAEAAFSMAGVSQGHVENWYQKMCEALSLAPFEEEERKKIVAVLAEEKAVREGTQEAVMLFERLMERV